MSLDLVPSVYRIIDEVKDSTGKAVEFIETDGLDTYAKVKIAREHMPAHIIFYSPKHDELINHLIAHECGHILRILKAPPQKRIVPMSDRDSTTKVIHDLASDLSRLSSLMPSRDILEMVNIWHHGIITQLTSYPSDIMIERWIHASYKELRPCQRKSIMNQHADAIKVLSPKIKEVTPIKIYEDSIIMNIVFFSMLGSTLRINLLKPFKNLPVLKRGKVLSTITEKNLNDSYEGDTAMINCWADFFGLKEWFNWTNFENLPNGYLESM
jgi:hypothetical protein